MNTLLLVNALYFLFGATMYMGTMWVLRLFLYPTWRALTPDNVDVHFGVPTRLATRFFTVVVPLMLISGIVLVWSEWGSWYVVLATVCMVGIALITWFGQGIIVPVNKRIQGGRFDGQAGLTRLLVRWMRLNDIRFVFATVTWAAIVWYIAAKGDLWGALS
ncbi:anthrone oxygenase family protein [Streptomyces sp. NPDC046859]|uniref:anthrone oxygenase family protein n=1 Tax=Streptomyces sp. NPDC046859 TaxID=3155734 RepID=UPI0033FA0071